MKYIQAITTLLLAFTACMAVAQPVIVFDEQRHDFGTIPEKGGKVTCDFTFQNTGNEPLIISNVRTTCGCTAPQYTQEPILPGNKGNIKITFNPVGRPGKFSKSIYVYTNTDPERTILRIIGEVTRDEQEQQEQYAYHVGNLALKSLHIPLDKIIKGRLTTGFIEVENTGESPLTPEIEDLPPHITAQFVPATLQQKEKGILKITYDPDKTGDWGYRRDEFKINGASVGIQPDDPAKYNTVTLSGTLQEDFDSYTEEQRENAPILVIGNRNIDFKVIKGTQKVQREIYIFNAGLSPLTIHKVRSDNSVIKADIKRDKLKPGQSTKLIVEIDPMRARSNIIMSDIYVVSNDPGNPSQPIRITAELQ